ncbi:hypothetical protein Tsubulata_000307 [Turnera subulata]|uniref:DUF4408 domain-containing protein n=1 Tax=Turnera subulata TaxID=218843 RepID=A0A9Q0F2G5_9ROSI|nr:hypothetical protein Tsubulata_000307 [Turnera subulata]
MDGEAVRDFDEVKAEKASAMLKYNRLRNLTRLFRLVEVCVVLVLLSWTFSRLPFAVRISGDFFRRAARVVASPLFVFAVSNAIIAALIGRFSGENRGANNAAASAAAQRDNAAATAETEVYDEFVKNSDCINNNYSPSTTTNTNNISSNRLWHGTTAFLSENQEVAIESKTTEEQVVFQDKQIIVFSSSEANAGTCRRKEEEERGDDPVEADLRVFRRTKSEKYLEEGKARVKKAAAGKVLRRAETEKLNGGKGEEEVCPEDELSDEEFQRAVDEFIAKHLLFRRQESLCPVLHEDHNSTTTTTATAEYYSCK